MKQWFFGGLTFHSCVRHVYPHLCVLGSCKVDLQRTTRYALGTILVKGGPQGGEGGGVWSWRGSKGRRGHPHTKADA